MQTVLFRSQSVNKGKSNSTVGVIYKIPCADPNCDKVYIGQIARQLDTRIKEQKVLLKITLKILRSSITQNFFHIQLILMVVQL